jgi:hypothetical protein
MVKLHEMSGGWRTRLGKRSSVVTLFTVSVNAGCAHTQVEAILDFDRWDLES